MYLARLLLSLFLLQRCSAFSPIAFATSLIQGPEAPAKVEAPFDENNKLLVKRVAVIGATGRTGRWVVQELLDRGAEEVVAVVRSRNKAKEVFGSPSDKLKFVECDLTQQMAVSKALKGMKAAVWCATGFSTESNLVDRFKSFVGIATKQSIDLIGIPIVAKAIQKQLKSEADDDGLPKIVMCSSAGVTRPTWDEAKKQMFQGAADIPIVRLNPFGILDIKRESEEKLRTSNVPYCILRPAGLNDNWPAGSRPIVSQGDVAVGRTNRRDVATLLVDLLSEPSATGKTMEVITLANYPRGDGAKLTTSLERLVLDSDEDKLSQESIAATYATMQQLLPGEKQDAAALAMGQTYEQLDKGETGRMGKRGEEVTRPSPFQPTS